MMSRKWQLATSAVLCAIALGTNSWTCDAFGTSEHKAITSAALPFLKADVLADINDEHGYQDMFQTTSEFHCDNCRFSEFSTYVQEQYKLVLGMLDPKKLDSLNATDEFGQLLHAIQDFYAHSSWIDLDMQTIVDNGLSAWSVLSPWSSAAGAVVVQGEVRDIPAGWAVRPSARNPNVVEVSTGGAAWLPGLISGTWWLSDDCPDSVARSHGQLHKDTAARPGFSAAYRLARLQTMHEWCRLCSLVVKEHGAVGLTGLTNAWVKPGSVVAAGDSCNDKAAALAIVPKIGPVGTPVSIGVANTAAAVITVKEVTVVRPNGVVDTSSVQKTLGPTDLTPYAYPAASEWHGSDGSAGGSVWEIGTYRVTVTYNHTLSDSFERDCYVPPCGGDPPIWGDIMAFPTPEHFPSIDLNADGDTSDTILRYQNLETGAIVSTGLGCSSAPHDLDIWEETIVFVDPTTQAIRCHDIETGLVQETGGTGSNPAIHDGWIAFAGDDGTILLFNLSESILIETGVLGSSPAINGGVVAFEAGTPRTIWCYSIETGIVTDTGAVGRRPAIYEDRIVFTTPETDLQEDLNGDGDLDDLVIRYHDLVDHVTTNTRATGDWPAIYGDVVVFSTLEASVSADLDGDGRTVSFVIQYLHLPTGVVTNTGEPGAVPDIYGGTISYHALESWSGYDLSGDGDILDSVVLTCSVRIPDAIPGAEVTEPESMLDQRSR